MSWIALGDLVFLSMMAKPLWCLPGRVEPLLWYWYMRDGAGDGVVCE